MADWQAIGTIATGVGVIVAAVGVVGSLRITARGQRQEQTIAENSALRASASARLTEEYTARVVDALEAMAASGLGTAASVHQLQPRVRWSLRRLSGERYILENGGDATARDVHVEGHPSLGGLIDVQGGPNLGPTEGMSFLAAPSMETSDTTITVSWTNADGSTDTWRYPLPE